MLADLNQAKQPIKNAQAADVWKGWARAIGQTPHPKQLTLIRNKCLIENRFNDHQKRTRAGSPGGGELFRAAMRKGASAQGKTEARRQI